MSNLTRDLERTGGAPTPAPTLSPADVAAHAAASFVRNTSAGVNRSAARAEICRETIERLSAMDARDLSGAQFDLLASARAELDSLTPAVAS
ncbi:hypothetical protein GCM10011583_18280 [Streptomyces camponoticapitis]|uniref:Uncharacterized protein n=1 Tax=Streptomyces camponoticapitis TaxID=1616125 RepID=A0ABQ2E1D2_9ACTN|nr:hypothetical protein [Streptomyces camponoticapitis]GGJ87021.1 hypothetical protein GCM10011583_18280 [Streptomyces camponoticapitis]